MKSLIVLVLGLLSVGCLTPEQKQKRLRDSVVGEYEYKNGFGETLKYVFLDNGIHKYYASGKKVSENKWSIVNGDIHVKYNSELIGVFIINIDKSITNIAKIKDGKRTERPKEYQLTWKKIK